MNTRQFNRGSRKYGKQKTTLLKSRTSARKVFATVTEGQQALINKAKTQQILFVA